MRRKLAVPLRKVHLFDEESGAAVGMAG